jgi:hypothetical protein
MFRKTIALRYSSPLLFFLWLFAFHIPAFASGVSPVQHEEVDRGGKRNGLSPGLVLPDLRVLPPFGLRLILDNHPDQAILRFSNSIVNAGPGSLELIGKPDWATNQISVIQSILTTDGTLEEHPVGVFIFHPHHEHWHLEGFGLYEVWSLTPSGKLDTRLSTSGKISYCVMDSDPWPALLPEPEPSTQKYTACGWAIQGISPGWVDTYKASVAGQWIDITGFASGNYALVSWVDPGNLLVEVNENNNRAITYFQFTDRRLVRFGATLNAVGINPEHIVPYE